MFSFLPLQGAGGKQCISLLLNLALAGTGWLWPKYQVNSSCFSSQINNLSTVSKSVSVYSEEKLK